MQSSISASKWSGTGTLLGNCSGGSGSVTDYRGSVYTGGGLISDGGDPSQFASCTIEERFCAQFAFCTMGAFRQQFAGDGGDLSQTASCKVNGESVTSIVCNGCEPGQMVAGASGCNVANNSMAMSRQMVASADFQWL